MESSSFIPPISTKENAHQWYKQSYNLIDLIVNSRKELIIELKDIMKKEIELLENEWNSIRVTIYHLKV